MAGAGDTSIEGFVISLKSASYRMRPPEPGDADAYVDYLKRNWPRFRGAMPTTDTFFDPETWRRRFAVTADAAEPPGHAAMMIFDRDDPRRIVGDVTFSNIILGPFRACHVGFKIDQDLEGFGLMRRALEIGCDRMFEGFGLHRIMANYRPENVRSGGLLKRLGFQVEGFARDYLHLDGEWRDHILTALVRPGEP